MLVAKPNLENLGLSSQADQCELSFGMVLIMRDVQVIFDGFLIQQNCRRFEVSNRRGGHGGQLLPKICPYLEFCSPRFRNSSEDSENLEFLLRVSLREIFSYDVARWHDGGNWSCLAYGREKVDSVDQSGPEHEKCSRYSRENNVFQRLAHAIPQKVMYLVCKLPEKA